MLVYFQGNIVHITKEVYLVAPFKQSQERYPCLHLENWPDNVDSSRGIARHELPR